MKILIIFLIATITQFAHSKTIFEPGFALGQGTGKLSGTGVVANGSTASAEGTLGSVGFRYGITRRYIHVTAMLEGNFLSSEESKKEFIGYLGLGVGYEWNIPLRTYLLIGAYEFDTDLIGGGAEISYLFNDSFWVGIRYTDFKTQYKETIAAEVLSRKVSLSTFMLTVSLPFEFNYPDHWFRKTDWE